MKVYFNAAMTRYRKLLPLYQSLGNIIKELNHTIISEHVIAEETTNGDWIQTYEPEKLWQREMQHLQEADVLISEVTTRSFGVAFMIEEALKQKKPIISLYYALPFQKDLPLMLRAKPGINFKVYTEETARVRLQDFFSEVAK